MTSPPRTGNDAARPRSRVTASHVNRMRVGCGALRTTKMRSRDANSVTRFAQGQRLGQRGARLDGEDTRACDLAQERDLQRQRLVDVHRHARHDEKLFEAGLDSSIRSALVRLTRGADLADDWHRTRPSERTRTLVLMSSCPRTRMLSMSPTLTRYSLASARAWGDSWLYQT